MKKLAYLILTLICICSFSLFLGACGDGSNSTPGLKVRNIDGVYTVVGYEAEEGVSELAISTYTANDGTVYEIGAIKSSAFKGNTTLKKIFVADSVTEIGAGAFAEMTNLEYISLPFVGRYQTAYDGERLFGYVFGKTAYKGGYLATQDYNTANNEPYYLPETLTAVNISNSAEEFKLLNYAFNNVIRLESITFNKVSITNNQATITNEITNVVSIGDSAFKNCYGLASFTLPSTVETIGEEAFIMCSNLNGTMGIINGETNATDDFVISQNSQLKEIKKKAFLGTNLTAITLPQGLTTIGEMAFATETKEGAITTYGESKITKVVLPATIEVIDSYAFYLCTNLLEIKIGANIKSIGVGAFEACERLQTVSFDTTLANGVSIGAWAFYSCQNLSSFDFKEGIIDIGADAFSGCLKLENPVLPSTVEYVGDRAFANCASITNVDNLPTTVGNNLFKGSPIGVQFTLVDDEYVVASYTETFGVTDIVIPNKYKGVNVVQIQSGAFSNSTITSIKLPANIKSIGENAFVNTSALESLTFDKNITNIGATILNGSKYYDTASNWENGALYVGQYLIAVNNSVTTLSVKEGTLLIASGACAGVSTITAITLNDGLKYICQNAFDGVNLVSELTIVASVEEIGENAFANNNITTLKINSLPIANSLNNSTDCGSVANNATKIYVSKSIVNMGGLITSKTLSTSDIAGYDLYE